jgi:hypothetical protein
LKDQMFQLQLIGALGKRLKGVKLFSWGVHFVENFTLCDLDHFDSILGNIFLDAYGIDVFCNKKNMCQGRL